MGTKYFPKRPAMGGDMVGTIYGRIKRNGLALRTNPLKFLARPERFERPTVGFEVRCSIQLSHGRAGAT